MSRNEINESNKADIPLKSGTLIRGIGSFYTVRDSDHQEYTLRCKKKFRRDGISPLVGVNDICCLVVAFVKLCLSCLSLVLHLLSIYI